MRVRESKVPLFLAPLLFCAVFLASPVILGQEGAVGLEEIVVTARKREENLQDVGLAVSALSKTEIDQQFTRDIKGLAGVAPNIILADTNQGPGGNAAFYIRGMGIQDVEKNYEPAVPVIIDDVAINSHSGAIIRSIDLETMTVARGPQGTMFGRNSLGGAIIVTRSKPTGEPGLKVKAGFEEYETSYFEAVGNVALSDALALKFTAASREQDEGYYYNVHWDRDQGRNDFNAYGAALLWTPSDDLEVQLSYNKDEMDQDTPALVYTAQPSPRPSGSPHILCDAFGYCAQSVDVPQMGDRQTTGGTCFKPTSFDSGNKYGIATTDYDAANGLALHGIAITPIETIQEVPCLADFSSELTSLKVSYAVNDSLTLDYVYGFYETDESILSTWDLQDALMFGTSRPAVYEQASHELRLSYDDGDRFNVVAGLYMFDSEYEIWLRSWIGFNPPTLALDIYQYTHQWSESDAIFFEADYALNDALTLTVGGRYTEDWKTSHQIGGQADTSPDHPEKEWSKFTPKLGVRYDYSESMMMFATFSTGYRAGGYNGRVGGGLTEATLPYDPETVDNFEIGIKSEWMDGRLRLNASAFTMDFEDKQEETKEADPSNATGQVSLVRNAAQATISGLEVEIQAQVSDALYVRANAGFLDAEYDEFSYASSAGPVDFSSRDMRRTPDITANIDVTYSWDTAGGEAWVRAAGRYIDKHFVDNENTIELENDDGILTLDASVNYRRDDLTVSLFGRNLTDEDAWTMGYDVAPLWSYGAIQEPRIFGVEMMFEYN